MSDSTGKAGVIVAPEGSDAMEKLVSLDGPCRLASRSAFGETDAGA